MATILCPRTTCLRSVPSATRTLATPTTHFRAAFSISTKPTPAPAPRLPSNTFTSNITTRLQRQCAPTRIGLRHASTPSGAAGSDAIPDHILTWDRFFDLRKKRRWINLGCSVITAGITVAAVTPILVNQDFDTWGAQISGLDPVIVIGITTFGVAAAGWLCGPSFGNNGFRVWAARKGWNQAIAEKEKSFYARIKRYRADPSASSPQNPIPDYYGEKIASVKDYRRWLKDQKAFNLKKNKNMI